jgi:tetratricopeptide (TPR) repeat protein
MSVDTSSRGHAPAPEQNQVFADIGLERGLPLEDVVAAALEHIDRVLAATPSHDVNGAEAAARLHLAAGRVLERVGQDTAAQSRFAAARRRNPASLAALRKVRAQARRHGEHARIPALLYEELAMVTKTERRVALLLERASLAAARSDYPAALTDALAAAQITPHALAVLETLRGIYISLRSWPEAADTLCLMAEIAADPALRHGWLMVAAHISEHRLDQPQRAAELLEAVLKAAPDHAAALVCLERLLVKASRWETLWQAQVRCAEHSAARGAPAAEVFGRYMYAAVIAREHLQRPEAAIVCLEAAAKLLPEDPRPLTALMDLYTSQGGWNALDQTATRLLGLITHPSWRARLMLLRARNLSEHLNQPNAAIEVLEALLSQQPTHPLALETLRRLLLADSRLKPLIDRDWAAAERSSPRALQAERFTSLGRFCSLHDAWNDTAIEALKRALALDVQHVEAFDLLENLFRKRRDWGPLSKLYAHAAEHAAMPRRAALLWTLARLQGHELSAPADAIQTLRTLRDLCPEDLAVLWDLQRLCQLLGRWTDVTDALQAEVGLSDDPTRRAALLCRVAHVRWQHLNQPLAALEACELALSDDPDHLAAHDARLRLLRSLERWPDLLDSLEVIERLTPPDALPSLLCEMGDILSAHLGRPDEAIRAYERCLAVEPRYLPAFEALERLHLLSKRWPDLLDVMSRQTALDMPLAARHAAWTRIASLMSDRFSDLPQAERALREALRCSPDDPFTLQRLEGLLSLSGQWQAQAALLNDARSHQRLPDRIASTASRHGALLAWPLNQPADAVHLFEHAQRLAPSSEHLFELDALFRLMNQPQPLSQTLGALAQNTSDSPFAVAVGRELVSILCDVQNDDTSGILRAILQRDPADRFALDRLDALVGPCDERADLLARQLRAAELDEDVELRLELSEALMLTNQSPHASRLAQEALLRSPAHLIALRLCASAASRNGDHEIACSLREREADATPDLHQRIASLLRAADIANSHLNQPPRVRQLLFKALQLQPANASVFLLLVEQLRKHQAWEPLSQTLRLHLTSLPAADRPPLLFELAKVMRDHLRRTDDAAQALRDLLAIEPLHIDALGALAQLELERQRWQEAAQALRDLIAAADQSTPAKLPPKALRTHRLDLARVLSSYLNLPEEARAILQELLSAHPDDLDALALYARLLEDQGFLVEALEALKRLVPLLPPLDAVKTSLRMADLARAIDHPDAVREHLVNAARQALRDINALAPLLAWPRTLDDTQTVARLLDALLRQAPASPQITPIRMALASLLADRLNRSTEAEVEARKAAQASPTFAPAQVLAARLQTSAVEARRFALQAIQADPFSPDAFAILARVSEESHLRDAAGTFQQALIAFGAIDPAQAEWARRLTRFVQRPSVTPDPTEWAQLLSHPEDIPWGRELLSRATFAAQIFRLTPPDAQPAPQDHSASHQARLVATQTGLAALEAWIAPNAPAPFAYHPEHEPILVLNAIAAASAEATIRFHLAWGAAPMVLGSHLLALLDDTDLLRLIQSLIGLQFSGYGEVELTKQLKGHFLPRKARGAVMDFLKVNDPRTLPFDLLGWRRATQAASLKLATVLARDVHGALTALLQRAGIRQPLAGSVQDRIALLRQVPDAAALLQFITSDDYFRLRARLNLILPAQ